MLIEHPHLYQAVSLPQTAQTRTQPPTTIHMEMEKQQKTYKTLKRKTRSKTLTQQFTKNAPARTNTQCQVGELKKKKENYYEAFGSEVAETKVAEDDLRRIEEVEGAAVMTAKVERLRLHVYIGRVRRNRRHLVGKEDRRRVQMLAHAVPDHSPELLYLLFPHFLPANTVK